MNINKNKNSFYKNKYNMYKKLTNQDFSDHPMYTTGKYGIKPLNDGGVEHYLGSEYFNYHFLSKVYPYIVKECLDEIYQKKNVDKKEETNLTPKEEKKEIEHIEQCKDECHRTIKTKEKKQKEVKQIEKVNSKPHTNRPKKTKREERMEEELKERNRTHKVNDYYRSKTKPEFPIIATVEGTRPVY